MYKIFIAKVTIHKLIINTGKHEQQSKPCELSIPGMRLLFTSWIISGVSVIDPAPTGKFYSLFVHNNRQCLNDGENHKIYTSTLFVMAEAEAPVGFTL